MSLAQLLQGYSEQAVARTDHAQEMQDQNQERKASTMEQHFEQAQALLEAAGGQVTGVSVAYHTGRKLYKKYQEKYGKKKPGQGDDQDGTDENNEPTEDEPSGDSMPAEARPAPVEKQTVSEEPDLDTIPEEDEGDEDDAGDAGDAGADAAPPAADAAPAPAADAAPAPDAGGDAAGGGGDAADAADAASDTGSSAFDAAMARPAPVTAQPAAPAADAPAPDAPDAPSTSVGGQDITTAPDAPPAPDSGADLGDSIPGGADRPPVGGAVGEGESGADDLLSAARSATSKLTGQAGSVLDSVGEKAGNIAGQAAKKLGVAAGTEAGESAGFLTTEGVLDALGPIGEVGGAIMGLIGLFKSLFHKDDTTKPAVPTPSSGPVATASTAIDPNALVAPTQVVGTVI